MQTAPSLDQAAPPASPPPPTIIEVRFLDAPDLPYQIQIRPAPYGHGVYCCAAPLFGRNIHKRCLGYWLPKINRLEAEQHILERLERIVLQLIDARRPGYLIED